MRYFVTNERQITKKFDDIDELINYVPHIVQEVYKYPKTFEDLVCKLYLIENGGVPYSEKGSEIRTFNLGNSPEVNIKNFMNDVFENINNYERYAVQYDESATLNKKSLKIRLVRG